MINKNKYYDVTYLCPIRKREVTCLNANASRLHTDNQGNLRFEYNHYYTSCEVVSVKEVSDAYLEAMAEYFQTFGTAAE